MDPERVRAYLQVACAGLGFDIGEVWWTSNANPSNGGSNAFPYTQEQKTSDAFRFVQLYTSKSYSDRRSMLVNPPEEDQSHVPSNGSDLEKHVLSPLLVDAIAKTSQVVWANTKKQEGLLGRSDIKLQTAVGLPVVVDGSGNMCVVVMFSPNNVQSSDDALEYLQSINFSASSAKIPSLMPAFDPRAGLLTALSQNKMAPNVVIPLLSSSYADGITTQFVPLGGGSARPLLTHDHDFTQEEKHERDVKNAPKDSFGIPMLPIFAELQGVGSLGGGPAALHGSDVFDEASYGVWSTVMGQELPECYEETDSMNFDPEPMACDQTNVALTDGPLPLFDPHRIFLCREKKDRLEEFISAFLTMSIFDIADIWMPATESSTHLLQALSMTSLESNQFSNEYKTASSSTSIRLWSGAVGRAFSSGNPVWSTNSEFFIDEGRADILKKMKIHTVFAVPIFAEKSNKPVFVLSFYSFVRMESVPFVLRFVQQAVRLLWDGLDQVDPHESVGKQLWRDVAPADLGEMAADDEMQRHFLSKKRPRSNTLVESDLVEDSNPQEMVLDDSSTDSSHIPQAQSIYVGKELRPLTPDSRSSSIESMANHQPQQRTTIALISNNWNLQSKPNGPSPKKRSVLPSKSFSDFQEQATPKPAPPGSPAHSSSMPDLRNSDDSTNAGPLVEPVFCLPLQVINGGTNGSIQGAHNPPPAPRPLVMPSLVGIPFPPPTGRSSSEPANLHSQSAMASNQYSSPLQQPQSIFQPSPGHNYQTPQQQKTTSSAACFSLQPEPLHHPAYQPVSASLSAYQLTQPQFSQFQTPPSSTPQSAPSSSLGSPPSASPLVRPILFQKQSDSYQTPHSTTDAYGTPVAQISSTQNEFSLNQAHTQNVSNKPLHQQTTSNYSVFAQSHHSQPLKNTSATSDQTQPQNGTTSLASDASSPGVLFAAVPVNQISSSGITLPQHLLCRPASATSDPNVNSNFLAFSSQSTEAANVNINRSSSGSKPCRIQGCNDPAQPRRPHCSRHSGNRLCERQGCKKCAQGSTRFCIAHGGGRRCTHPGCDKGARDKFFCAAHGGGKRCRFEGCTKSAVGGSQLCTAHGGGKRCSVDGCDKSAQSSTKFCVKHGGGKQCLYPDCYKVARGRTMYCAAHGGGVRCTMEGCNRLAIGKAQLCRTHGGGSRAKPR